MASPISALFVSSLAVGLSVSAVLACGGGTPPPKHESDTNAGAASSAAPGDSSTAASDAPAPSSAPAPAASSAQDDSGPKPTATMDANGNIKTGGDDPWNAAHQMPPADVLKTMRAASGKVQACWKTALKNDPSTSGEVKIRLVITNDGKVRVWKDDGSSMSDADVTQCIGGVVEKLKFPKQKSPGDAWGTYSIHFGG